MNTILYRQILFYNIFIFQKKLNNILYKQILSITIDLIMYCVTASSLSLIWNGTRLLDFTHTRVLHQGDPLSPYLFVIFMEILSHDILKAVELNQWKLVSISRNEPTLSHLYFADDNLLFTKSARSQAIMVEGILTNFANISKS